MHRRSWLRRRRVCSASTVIRAFQRISAPSRATWPLRFPSEDWTGMQGAGFYFHIAPTELWIGGGIYRPAADELRWVRDHIAENHGRLKKIVDARQFRKLFGELAGEQSSRMPRGYRSDHPAEHYLRHKDFLAARELAPAEATKPNFLKTLVESFRSMHPLIRFLNEPILRRRQERDRHDRFLSS